MKTRESSQFVRVTLIFIPCVLCLLSFVSPPALAVSFAGGTGELNNPYQIATAEQLIAIGSDPNLSTKHYRLMADIDLAGITRFQPVVLWFSGSFDGNGHTIRNLHVDGEDIGGLFGFIGRDAQVMDLGVVDAHVGGGVTPGALASHNLGRVVNCYSTGTVTGSGGGLVGSNIGTIVNSWSAVSMDGEVYVGGLVGENTGSISSCYSTGDVKAGSDAGGLVGLNGGLVSSCYSTGRVQGSHALGGLVGINGGQIDSSYSVASTKSHGPYSPSNSNGGLVGMNFSGSGSSVKDCYFLAFPDGGGPDKGIGTPLTGAQMKQKASFSGWDFSGDATDGTNDQWFMPPDAYPVLAWQTDITGLTAIPDVMGLTLEEAKAALTAAGFIVGTVNYENSSSVAPACVIRTYPHSFALAGSVIDIFVNFRGTRG